MPKKETQIQRIKRLAKEADSKAKNLAETMGVEDLDQNEDLSIPDTTEDLNKQQLMALAIKINTEMMDTYKKTFKASTGAKDLDELAQLVDTDRGEFPPQVKQIYRLLLNGVDSQTIYTLDINTASQKLQYFFDISKDYEDDSPADPSIIVALLKFATIQANSHLLDNITQGQAVKFLDQLKAQADARTGGAFSRKRRVS